MKKENRKFVFYLTTSAILFIASIVFIFLSVVTERNNYWPIFTMCTLYSLIALIRPLVNSWPDKKELK